MGIRNSKNINNYDNYTKAYNDTPLISDIEKNLIIESVQVTGKRANDEDNRKMTKYYNDINSKLHNTTNTTGIMRLVGYGPICWNGGYLKINLNNSICWSCGKRHL